MSLRVLVTRLTKGLTIRHLWVKHRESVKREREILTAIVETYISTGEPVGSRTLARTNRESLSPASIRNVMSDLADAGFLEQPHTSSGRVPTAQAYRYYVKQLTGEARLRQRKKADPS